MLLYDPPSGWKYGFPKPYKPLEGETLTETLIRDGYPPEAASQGPVRFWSDEPLADPKVDKE
jgi:hypothetical protein